MSIRREERGAYLIETGAHDLDHGAHWKPWLRLTRRVDGVCVSDTFDGLKPVFGAEQSALGYVTELGRSLADEGWAPSPAARGQDTGAPPLTRALHRARSYRTRLRNFACAKFMFTLTP